MYIKVQLKKTTQEGLSFHPPTYKSKSKRLNNTQSSHSYEYYELTFNQITSQLITFLS